MTHERKYSITLKMSGGDEIRAVAVGRTGNEALKTLKETDQYRQWMADHFGETIAEKTVVPYKWKPKDNDFKVTNSPHKRLWYMADHMEAGIRVEFKRGHFNDIQRVWLLDGGEKREQDPLAYATALRELADWLQEYFPEIV